MRNVTDVTSDVVRKLIGTQIRGQGTPVSMKIQAMRYTPNIRTQTHKLTKNLTSSHWVVMVGTGQRAFPGYPGAVQGGWVSEVGALLLFCPSSCVFCSGMEVWPFSAAGVAAAAAGDGTFCGSRLRGGSYPAPCAREYTCDAHILHPCCKHPVY